MGKNAYMYGMDLSRAYRQLRIDPGDWPLMGLKWKGKWYLDTTPAFGVRLGAHFCCRTTGAVCHLAAKNNRPMFAYIDDFIGWALSLALAEQAFRENRQLLRTLGLGESEDKATLPAQVVEWVGVTFNSVLMTMSIPQQKIDQIREELLAWLNETVMQLKELQKLLGRLFHATKCCHAARLFCNRLLDGLRVAYRTGSTPVNAEMQQDMFWLLAFLQKFNGVHIMRDPKVDIQVWVDACLSGGGAIWTGDMFTTEFTNAIMTCGWHISQLETFTLLLAIRWWQRSWAKKNVLIWCDNAATVAVLQSGRSIDPFIRACAREAWLLVNLRDIALTVRHIAGENNSQADTLSRAHLSPRFANKLAELEYARGRKATRLPLIINQPASLAARKKDDGPETLHGEITPDSFG